MANHADEGTKRYLHNGPRDADEGCMTRPVVGIVCCNRTIGHDQAQAVMERYMTAAMEHADVAALLIPSLPALMPAREVGPRLAGLLLTGRPSGSEEGLGGKRGVRTCR